MDSRASQNSMLLAMPEISGAAYIASLPTEMLEIVFENVPVRDLVRARRVCKNFDAVIMADKSPEEHKMKLFLTPSVKTPTDYTVWRKNGQLTCMWQPYIGTSVEAKSDPDDRARPIFDVNPALAQFVHPLRDRDFFYRFKDTLFDFDAEAFVTAIKDGSRWESMHLTQSGCSEVDLVFEYDKEACRRYLREQHAGQSITCSMLPPRWSKEKVRGTGPGGFVTLWDVKQTIRSMIEGKVGKWLLIHHVEMTIEECVTEFTPCVRHARLRERGVQVDFVFNRGLGVNWHPL